MLIDFTVGNVLSFRDKKTLSLVAASIKEQGEDNLIRTSRMTLLKGAVVYGANASGKSNLIRAMSIMRHIVLGSFGTSSTAELDITPFLLSTETREQPSFFEVSFLINETRYRYGFELDKVSVKAEWLYEAQKSTERPLFIREKDGIEVMKRFAEGKDLEEKTRDNALFLSVVDQFNGLTAKKIMRWFRQFIAISGLSHEDYKAITFNLLEQKSSRQDMLAFYRNLDLGFDDLALKKLPFDSKDLPANLPEALFKQIVSDVEGALKLDIRTSHNVYDKDNKIRERVDFDLRSQESSGTNKIFNISGPVFETLQKGAVLVIDELDASLHPLLTLAITRLFNSANHNVNNAQLIFTTHDTNLLHYGNYRRDQIYFMEKDPAGGSDLYSLVEYKEEGKTVRKDRSFEKDYIGGRYGAIPFIGNVSNLVPGWREK